MTSMIIHGEYKNIYDETPDYFGPACSLFSSVYAIQITHGGEFLEIEKDEKDTNVANLRILCLDLLGRTEETHKNFTTKL
jgi:hypothetical protein